MSIYDIDVCVWGGGWRREGVWMVVLIFEKKITGTNYLTIDS